MDTPWPFSMATLTVHVAATKEREKNPVLLTNKLRIVLFATP